MESSTSRVARIPIAGVFLVVAGVLLLLSKAHLLHFATGKAVWGSLAILGFLASIQGFVLKRGSRVFWGSFLFFASLYFSLVLWRVMPENGDAWFPNLNIAFGLAFVMLYALNVRNFALLLPVTIFIGIGAVYYLWVMEIVEMWEVRRVLRDYWPALLIVWGLMLVFARRR